MPKFKHAETGAEVDYPDGSFYAELAAESPEWKQVTGEPVVVPGVTEPPPPVEDERKPAKSAVKEDWVAYAIERGMPSFEASNLTKAELIERIEGMS